MLVPLVGLFFQAPITRQPAAACALLVAGTVGYAAVGTLFAAMLVRARSRDVMLPILLYPMTVPVMIAGVRGTAALFQATPDEPLGAILAGAAAVLRRRVRHARAVDVRGVDDRIETAAHGPRLDGRWLAAPRLELRVVGEAVRAWTARR